MDKLNNWHLDKKVGVGHLISTVTAILAVTFYVSKQDTRIALLEQATQQLITEDKKSVEDRAEIKRILREDLKLVHEKLDRLADTIRRQR